MGLCGPKQDWIRLRHWQDDRWQLCLCFRWRLRLWLGRRRLRADATTGTTLALAAVLGRRRGLVATVLALGSAPLVARLPAAPVRTTTLARRLLRHRHDDLLLRVEVAVQDVRQLLALLLLYLVQLRDDFQQAFLRNEKKQRQIN